MENFRLDIIARIHTDMPEKFGVPRQSGMVEELKGIIVFEPEYRSPEALRGLEGFSHIWLLWGFSLNSHDRWTPTVRPPRLGGNKRMGVFATRSPYRPNPIGLSCLRLHDICYGTEQGPVLHVSGVDMTDGTPVYDIKPYIPFCDCVPQAAAGFTQSTCGHMLKVDMGVDFPAEFSAQQKNALGRLLAYDPRPGYQHDDEREYAMEYSGYTVRFRVQGDTLYVLCVERV